MDNDEYSNNYWYYIKGMNDAWAAAKKIVKGQWSGDVAGVGKVEEWFDKSAKEAIALLNNSEIEKSVRKLVEKYGAHAVYSAAEKLIEDTNRYYEREAEKKLSKESEFLSMCKKT